MAESNLPAYLLKYPAESAVGHCCNCGKVMPPLKTGEGYLSRSNSIAMMDPHGLFCTLRCAAAYGVNNAQALRRLK